MRKIVIHCTTSTVGTDSWEFIEVPYSLSDAELNEMANEYAVVNAEMYGIYPASYEDSEFEYDEEAADNDDYDDYDDSIEGTWYDYSPELHDDFTTTGVPSWK